MHIIHTGYLHTCNGLLNSTQPYTCDCVISKGIQLLQKYGLNHTLSVGNWNCFQRLRMPLSGSWSALEASTTPSWLQQDQQIYPVLTNAWYKQVWLSVICDSRKTNIRFYLTQCWCLGENINIPVWIVTVFCWVFSTIVPQVHRGFLMVSVGGSVSLKNPIKFSYSFI